MTSIKEQANAGLVKTKASIAGYLQRPYSDPGHLRPVVSYCLEGVGFFAKAVAETWSGYTGKPNDDLVKKINQAFSEQFAYKAGRDNVEDYEMSKGRVKIARPQGLNKATPNADIFGSMAGNAGNIDPHLVRYEYAWYLEPSFKNSRTPLELLRGRFRGYDTRYKWFLNVSGLDQNSSWSNLVSLIYFEQMAKVRAVDTLTDQLKALGPQNPTYRLIPPTEEEEAVKFVKRRLDPTLYHLGFLERVKLNIGRIQNSMRLSEETLQVLYDVAFFRGEDLPSGEFTALLGPIVNGLVDGDFDLAAECRNYLLKKFSANFPAWRRQEGQSYKNIRELVIDVASQERDLLGESPGPYHEVLSDHLEELKKKQELVQLKEQEMNEIIRRDKLTAALLLASIGLVSVHQGKTEGWSYDLEKEISPANPLTLRYRLVVQNMDKLSATTTIEYSGFKFNERGVVTHLQELAEGFYEQSTHKLDIIFANLYYEELLDIDLIKEAWERLRKEGLVEERDSLSNTLGEVINTRIDRIEKHIGDTSYIDDIVETGVRKIAMLRELQNAITEES